MAITYTWKVTGVKTKTEGGVENAVVQTYWQKIGTDESGNVGTFNGATPFSMSSIDPANFVPFDQLTEPVVIGWIQGVVVGGYEEHVNSVIQKQIDEKVSPVTEAQLPWAPPPPPPAEPQPPAPPPQAAPAP